jgi:hypothetical protein
MRQDSSTVVDTAICPTAGVPSDAPLEPLWLTFCIAPVKPPPQRPPIHLQYPLCRRCF